MTWREVWEANLAYDLRSSNLDEATYRQFQADVEECLRRTPPLARDVVCCSDDKYLTACEVAVGMNERYLLSGRPTSMPDNSTFASVCTLRTLRECHCAEESISRGQPSTDYLRWFRADFAPCDLKPLIQGRRSYIWLTQAEVIDEIQRTEAPETVATTLRDRLALGHDAGEHYVKFSVDTSHVAPPVRAPTTLDGGTHSLFVAAADAEGWGRTCDVPDNMFQLPEVVARGIRPKAADGNVTVTYVGQVQSPPPHIDLSERARVVRNRLQQV